MKSKSLIIILIIMASGAGYAFGQFPIAGFKEEISQIETENIALQSQVEELNKDNNDIQELLEATLANLSETQSAYQNLFEKYLSVENNLTEIQYGFEQLLTSYEEVKNQLEGIDFNNSVLLSLYSSLWETYTDLLARDASCDMHVNDGLEFEIISNGVVEWTDEVSYDDYDIIKLVIPEGAMESSGAIVKSPLNIPFRSLESFSYCVSFESARPRFRIYLDTNGDDAVDTILRSDYQDFGTGEWSFATGGLRWGWTTPPGPWSPLAYWRNKYSDAQVLYVGLYLDYWGAHPEGIGEPLYVANFVCVNTF